MSVEIRPARPGEAGLVLNFVRELAAYEKLADEVEADEGAIDDALFAKAPKAFCDIAEWDGEPVGFALWFLNFSSFRGRNGLISRTFSCGRRTEGAASAAPSCGNSPNAASRRDGRGWNGRFSTGTSPPSTSTRLRAQRFCGTGRSAGSAEARCGASAAPTRTEWSASSASLSCLKSLVVLVHFSVGNLLLAIKSKNIF